LYVKVHRGTNRVGGSIIEVGTTTTRILFDAGTELDAPDDALRTRLPGRCVHGRDSLRRSIVHIKNPGWINTYRKGW
jgi:hypothetical protein